MTELMALVAVLCGLSVVLEMACMREPSIPDNPLSMMGRRILITGLLILGGRLTYLVAMRDTSHVSVIGLIGIGFIAGATVIRCGNRLALMADKEREEVR